MAERHPYVLMRCHACSGLVEPALGRTRAGAAGESDLEHAKAPFVPPDEELGPPGSGLLLFVRGDEVRYEEPPLCSRCSVAIGVTALVRWAEEEEEG
jgi:hypothetical protein